MRRLIAWIAFVAASTGAAGYNPRRRLVDSSDCTCDKELEVTVRTDNWPSETSWTLSGVDCSRSGVLAERNDYVDQGTTYVDTINLCEGGTYTFEISDSYGDGICCSYGDGFYSLTLDGVEIQRGGDFGSGDVYEFFGTDAPTFAPTVTPKPSPEPTFAPTASPLVAVDGDGDDGIRTAVALWLEDRAIAIRTYGHISTWETGGVTDMSYLFCGWQFDTTNCNAAAASFNDNISAWNTSGVTNMRWMFNDASAFNQPIGGWRVDKVTRMYRMFGGASAFNQPIGDWRVDKVTDMGSMFYGASSFNQPLNHWRVDKVTDLGSMFMGAMFYRAEAFDQALGWCVRDDVYIYDAFAGTKCEAFSCGVVQGACPDLDATAGKFCKLSDPELCSGSHVSFVEVPSNPFANIKNRYSVPILADVDSDGSNDLLVGREDGKLAFYYNTGSGFQHVVGDEDPFKSVAVGGRAAPALVDLDGDGLLDLVVGAQGGGLAFYANTGTATAPVFTNVSNAMTPCGDRLVGVNASECPASTEAFQALPSCDIAACGELCEGDGECGTRDSLDNCGEDYCEGDRVYSHRCDVYRKLCNEISSGLFVGLDLAASFTAPAFADLDGDGLVDLVIGKETSGQGALTYYKNVGSRTAATFRAVPDGPFATVGVGSFSKPNFYDIDNDGDQDLIVGDNLGDVLLYLNIGGRFAPSFSLVDDTFAGITPVYAAPTFGVLNEVPSLVIGSARGQLVVYGEAPKEVEFMATKFSPFAGIDVGLYSTPSFADLDGDGLLDLVVGEYDGKLLYYRNVGTPSQPSFARVDAESPFEGIDVGRGSAPTFADLDGDGLLDLVVGVGGFDNPRTEEQEEPDSGKLIYYRNVGTQSQPKFEKVDEESPFDGIDVGYDSAPAFADLDDDGDLDLVVGEGDRALHYYRNVGNSSQPSFQKVGCVDDLTTTDSAGYDCSRYHSSRCSSSYRRFYSVVDTEDFMANDQCCTCGGGSTIEESPFDGIDVGYKSAPTFADLDNDGLLDLVVGEQDGTLLYYRNVGTPSLPSFEKIDEESPFDGIEVGSASGPGGYSAPTFADIDNDGDLDLVVGDDEGRLSYFQNAGSCRKGLEAGACSGNGFCGLFRDGEASCECVSTFVGAQCDACAAGAGGQDCSLCSAGTFSNASLADCATCAPGKTSNAGASFCFDCEAGKSRGESQEACTTCAEGTFAAAGQATCTNCTAGRFARETGSSVCDLAEPGFYVAFDGATAQTPCPTGKISGSAASECVDCGRGKYAPAEHMSSCVEADEGFFVGDEGASNQTACPLGAYSNARGRSDCLRAEPGYFVNETEATIPTPCRAGTYSGETGAFDCSLCSTGTYAAVEGLSSCTSAAPGFYVPVEGALGQIECPAGKISGSAASECRNCSLGTYAKEPGSDICTLADKGYFVGNVGLSKQTRCTAGTYTDVEGSPTCLLTDPGKEANADNSGQVACAKGETSESGGVCVPCGPGSYASAAGSPRCSPAEPGYYVLDGGDRTDQIECDEGFFSPSPRASKCIPCSPGTYTDAKAQSACKQALAGSYVGRAGLSAPTPCDSGTFTNAEGRSTCLPSAPGYYVVSDKTAQMACAEGETSEPGGVCVPCGPGSYASTAGSPSCTPAEKGYYVSDGDRTKQIQCDEGRYSPGSGASECLDCALGTYAKSKKADRCDQAKRGHYVDKEGASEEKRCERGTFCKDEGQSSCLDAKPGRYVPSEGLSEERKCPAGKTSESAADECEDCPDGSYSEDSGSPSCTLADPGYFVSNDDKTRQRPCEKGFHAPGSGGSECLECALGTYAESERSDTCDPARPGWYVDEKGASEEKECKRGTYTDTEGQSSCRDAQPGYFVDADGASEEVPCPAGQTSKSAAFVCESCDPGSFAATPGAARCELAQAGFYVPEDDSRAAVGSLATEAARTAAVPCPKGRYSPGPGAKECLECAAGTYAESEQSERCTPAEPGWFVEGEGASEPKKCERGTYTNAEGQSSCRDAKPGYFVASDGASEEKACARGKFSGPAATACDDCLAGSYAKETGQSTCDLASAGHYVKNKGATKETPCAEGFYAPSSGADECIPCALGTYADAKKQSSCKSASRGWYVDDVGASKPKKCERGTFTDAEGQSSCLDATPGFFVATDGASEETACSAGEFSGPRATKCTPCEPGSYAEKPGTATCSLAEAGHYVKDSDRTRENECPAGHYAPGPGTADECLECAVGTFAATEGTVTCKDAKKGYYVAALGAVKEFKCKAGTYTIDSGQSSCLDAKPGFFVATDGSSEETACFAGEFSGPGATSCTPCEPGSYTEKPGTATCSLAKAGHYVKDSDRTKEIPCEKGYYSPGPGASECFACSAGAFSEATGATKCTFAKPGWFVAVEGDSKETECPVGKYAVDAGSSRCTSAAAGSFVGAPGATKPTLCAPGRFVASSEATKCEDCSDGYYAANEGTAVCSLTVAGYYAASPGRRLAEAGARISAGATAHLPCPKGTFSLSGSSECTPCSAGKYAASERATECVSADPGFFVASASAYEQEACPEGHHASGSGNSECTLCESGKYAASAKSPECTLARQGYFVAEEGATAEAVCPVGRYSPGPGLFACVPANSGSFVAKEGAFVQESCPVGKFSSSPSSTECSSCPKGEFNSETDKSGCRPATSGHFVASEGASREEPCQPGTFASGSGNVACSDCSPGSYSDTDAASACTRAKHGHFVAEPRATSPKKCEVGKYAPGEGSSSCTDANAGFFVDGAAAKKQTPCPAGRFSATAASTCELCEAGTFSKRAGEASCTSCPAGSSSESGSTGCSECEQGTAKPAGPGACEPCGPGRFANKKGRGECKLADAGSFVAKSGAFGQKSCLPGTYSPGAGAVACTSCEEGRYVARERATACDLASGGEYVAKTGATKPFECTAGRFSGSGASSCEPCEPGTVSDAGASACILAEAGVATNAHPSYEITLQSELTLERYLDSPKNRSALASLLKDVIDDLADQPAVVTSVRPPPSKDGVSNTLSFTIEANYTAVWGEDMRNVSALMLDDFKSRFERLIAEGTLQVRLDASDVLAPAAIDVDASLDGVRRSDVNFIRVGPPGSFIGLTSDCPAGKSSQSGASECTDCLEGTYTAKVGQDTCQPCVPFSTTIGEGNSGCFACLDGYYRVPFEAGESGVYCSNTSALQDQCASEEDPNKCLFNECCKSCDDLGSGVGTCDAPTTLEALPVKPRYWRATELEDTIYRCFYERTCKGSPGGTNQTSYGDGLCRKGHKGPLCNVCENGYFFSPTELQCAKCRGASMAIYVIVVLVVVALLAILVYASLGSREQGKEIRGALLRRAKSRVRRSSSNISVESASDAIKEQSSSALTRSKIVISCYQIVAGIQELFPTIPWPVAYEQVARFFGLASLDISSLAHASCVFPGIDYIWSMEIATLWPIVVLLVTYLVFRRTKYRENWTYFAFLLIFLVFPSNSAMVLRYFSCVKFDARGRSPRTIKVLMADMSIGCRSDRYKLTRIFAWIMVIIYPIGVPLLCFAVLFWYRKRINPEIADALPQDVRSRMSDPDSMLRLKSQKKITAVVEKRKKDDGIKSIGFLYEDYEPRCWWFAVVELVRRLYLTGLLAFFGSNEEPASTTQTSLGLLGAIFYYIVMAHFEPYVDGPADFLAKIASIQVLLTFFGATMLQARHNSADEEAGDPRGMFTGPIFAAICVIVGVATITAALYLFLSELSKTRLAESASNSRLGKSLSDSLDYVKKKMDSLGSSDMVAAEETKDDVLEPDSPATPDSPPLEAAPL